MLTRMLGPGFAVEVSGVDPAGTITDAEMAELRGLLDRHELLVLRSESLTPDAQVSFVDIFCPAWDERRDASAHSYVSNVFGTFPRGRLLFHQDYAFTPWPHRVQSLYAQELAGGAAPTLFVSNTRAAERLTAEQRADWARLTAVHARDSSKSGGVDDEFTRLRLLELPDGDDEERYPRAVHPVIWNHPHTGKPTLFVNEYYTSHIVELEPDVGETIIQEACAVVHDPAGIYTHEWQLGDLVVWDNIALQHARSAVDPASRRTLRRVVGNDHVADPEFLARRQAIYSPDRPPTGSDWHPDDIAALQARQGA